MVLNKFYIKILCKIQKVNKYLKGSKANIPSLRREHTMNRTDHRLNDAMKRDLNSL